MARWDFYAKYVQEIDMGPIMFTSNEHSLLVCEAVRRQLTANPLLPNLWRMSVDPLNPPHHYITQGGQVHILGHNWEDASVLSLLLVSPSLTTFHFTYAIPDFPDFKRILQRAPHVNSLGITRSPNLQLDPLWGIPRFSAGLIHSYSHRARNRWLGVIEDGPGQVIFAAAHELKQFHSIQSVTISGSIIININISSLGWLPNLQKLSFQGCSSLPHLEWLLRVDMSGLLEHDTIKRFQALRQLEFLNCDSPLVLSLCQVKSLFGMVKHIHWALVGKKYSPKIQGYHVEQEFPKAMEMISQQATHLLSFEVQFPLFPQVPDEVNIVCQQTLLKRLGLIQVVACGLKSQKWQLLG